jgi:hypothetical protein
VINIHIHNIYVILSRIGLWNRNALKADDSIATMRKRKTYFGRKPETKVGVCLDPLSTTLELFCGGIVLTDACEHEMWIGLHIHLENGINDSEEFTILQGKFALTM